jgi:hypothetical protein
MKPQPKNGTKAKAPTAPPPKAKVKGPSGMEPLDKHLRGLVLASWGRLALLLLGSGAFLFTLQRSLQRVDVQSHLLELLRPQGPAPVALKAITHGVNLTAVEPSERDLLHPRKNPVTWAAAQALAFAREEELLLRLFAMTGEGEGEGGQGKEYAHSVAYSEEHRQWVPHAIWSRGVYAAVRYHHRDESCLAFVVSLHVWPLRSLMLNHGEHPFIPSLFCVLAGALRMPAL